MSLGVRRMDTGQRMEASTTGLQCHITCPDHRAGQCPGMFSRRNPICPRAGAGLQGWSATLGPRSQAPLSLPFGLISPQMEGICGFESSFQNTWEFFGFPVHYV